MRIFSKPLSAGGQVYRFHIPGKGASKPAKDETPEEASKRSMRDSIERLGALANAKNTKDLFFETTPGEIQDAPDWIRDDAMFGWATKEGKLIELPDAKGTPEEKSATSSAANEDEKVPDQTAIAEAMAKTPEDAAQAGNARMAPPGARRRRIVGEGSGNKA